MNKMLMNNKFKKFNKMNAFALIAKKMKLKLLKLFNQILVKNYIYEFNLAIIEILFGKNKYFQITPWADSQADRRMANCSAVLGCGKE